MLRVIVSPKKPNYSAMYIDAFIRTMRATVQDDDNKYKLKQIVFYGIKAMNSCSDKSPDSSTLETRIALSLYINSIISRLTPAELLTIFPVQKTYDGAKYECKDYFSTMKALKEHGLNKPIGEEPLELLWDYMNGEINEFAAGLLTMISKLRWLEGELGLMEEFALQKGITLSTVSKDRRGRMFLADKDGKIKRVYRKRPRYLQPVLNAVHG